MPMAKNINTIAINGKRKLYIPNRLNCTVCILSITRTKTKINNIIRSIQRKKLAIFIPTLEKSLSESLNKCSGNTKPAAYTHHYSILIL
jgi:hypothetical protein